MTRSRRKRGRPGPQAWMAPDDLTYFVGMRVSELPEPYVPSIKGECQLCHEAIWVSRKDVGIAFRVGRTICVECFVQEIEPQAKQRR